jgi:hypothetical protein
MSVCKIQRPLRHGARVLCTLVLGLHVEPACSVKRCCLSDCLAVASLPYVMQQKGMFEYRSKVPNIMTSEVDNPDDGGSKFLRFFIFK